MLVFRYPANSKNAWDQLSMMNREFPIPGININMVAEDSMRSYTNSDLQLVQVEELKKEMNSINAKLFIIKLLKN